MAVQHFYWSYDIDDSAIKCNSVIVADCDGTHRYKTVCDLMSECLPPQQLTNECIVDFLNSDLTNRNWQFVKVNSQWCLTTWDINCPCDDRKVAATSWDTSPDTLDKKLIGWCNWPYCITVSTPNSRTVQVLPSWPSNWFINYSGWYPDCDEAVVKMKRNWDVFVECPEVQEWMRYAICTHEWWSCKFPRGETGSIVAPIWGSSSSDYNFSWTWSIKATPGFSVWSEGAFINIEEPGLYLITYESYVMWTSQTIYALRAWIQRWGTALWDVKYNWTVWKDTTSQRRQPVNFLFPNQNTYEWASLPMNFLGLSFSWTFVLPAQWNSVANPLRVKFSVKPDTRTEDPRMTRVEETTLYLPNAAQETWPKTVVTITKINSDPAQYWFKTLI